MEFQIAVLCLVASTFSSVTCYPPNGRASTRIRLTESSGQDAYDISSNNYNNHFKEPQTDYFHPNSVYYDNQGSRPSTQESYFYVSGSNRENEEKLADKEQEIRTSQPYAHYPKERSEQEVREDAPSQSTSNQAKLQAALREVAATLEAIQRDRQNKQQQQRKDAPPPKPETPIYDVRTEQLRNFPPFTPELYPKAEAGPLSILEQLGGSVGSLW